MGIVPPSLGVNASAAVEGSASTPIRVPADYCDGLERPASCLALPAFATERLTSLRDVV